MTIFLSENQKELLRRLLYIYSLGRRYDIQAQGIEDCKGLEVEYSFYSKRARACDYLFGQTLKEFANIDICDLFTDDDMLTNPEEVIALLKEQSEIENEIETVIKQLNL